MKSVITKFEIDPEMVLLGSTRYVVEIRGEVVPNLVVEKNLNTENGHVTVRVQVPRGTVAVSTMDALARRVDPTARAYAGNKGGASQVRLYAVERS